MKFLLTILLGLVVIQNVCCKETTTTQSAAQTPTTTEPPDYVLVHFMDFKRTEFLEALPEFKKKLASMFQEWCENSTDSCYLNNANVTEELVDFLGTTDKERFVEDNRYVIAKMVVKRPGDDEGRILERNDVHKFLNEKRDEIAKETGVQIAFIDDKFVFPKRNNLDNYIIIPISCAVFLALFVINLVCTKISDKKAKEDFLKRFQQPPKAIVKRSSSNERNDNYDRPEQVQLIGGNKGSAKYSKDKKDSPNRSPKKSSAKNEVTTAAKRKKCRNSKDPNFIAGSANEGIGSTHQLTNEDTWNNKTGGGGAGASGSGSGGFEQRKQQFGSFHNNYSIEDSQMNVDKYKPQYISGDVSENQHKRNRNNSNNNNRNNYEYPDHRVAQRLASYERLPSTYDNMRAYEPFPKPKTSGSTKKVDI